MKASKANKASASPAQGSHANSGDRASQARYERAVERARLHMAMPCWERCMDMSKVLSHDERAKVVDQMCHALKGLLFRAGSWQEVLSDICGCHIDVHGCHHYDGDDQYDSLQIELPFLDAQHPRVAVVAMVFMVTCPCDLDLEDHGITPMSLERPGFLEIYSQMYGADIFGEDHPEYVLPGTIEDPLINPALLKRILRSW